MVCFYRYDLFFAEILAELRGGLRSHVRLAEAGSNGRPDAIGKTVEGIRHPHNTQIETLRDSAA
jgi:hypothetical protein